MEWNFEKSAPLWKDQTKAVQHVGVPGYQWQTAVLWDGSLGFGPFGFRRPDEFPGARIESFLEEIAALGESRLHLSFAYGGGAKFFDFPGHGSKSVKKWLEDGREFALRFDFSCWVVGQVRILHGRDSGRMGDLRHICEEINSEGRMRVWSHGLVEPR